MSQQRSRTVQRDIYVITSAASVFESHDENGEIPVVLIPKYFSHNCFTYYTNIPSGVYVLYQKFGAHVGLLPAGVKLCWPAWYRVSHIVTRAARTYNHPVKKVPTSDNVLIDIDVSLTFQIGPDEDAPVKFVYELGAQRFDDMLSTLTDEAIRGLVNTVTHDRVHDLREEFAQGAMQTINRKISRFGVTIRSVKVTNVDLPKELNDNLQNTTAFKTRMEEEEKKHQNRMRQLLDSASQELTGIEKENARRAQDLRAARERALIRREEEMVAGRSELEVKVTQGKTDAAVTLNRAEGQLAASTAQGQKAAEEMVEKTRRECDAEKVAYDQEARTRVKESEARLSAAENQAAAVSADAQAEEKVARHLADQRQFEVDQARLAVMAQLARTCNVVISGETGDQVLQTICPGSTQDMGAGKKASTFMK